MSWFLYEQQFVCQAGSRGSKGRPQEQTGTDTMRLHIAVNSNKQDDNGEGMQDQTSSLITVALWQMYILMEKP